MQDATIVDKLFASRFEQMRIQGLQEGRQEGQREGLRAGLMDILRERFTVPEAQQRRIEKHLHAIDDLDQLRALLLTLVRTPDAAAFEEALDKNAA